MDLICVDFSNGLISAGAGLDPQGEYDILIAGPKVIHLTYMQAENCFGKYLR